MIKVEGYVGLVPAVALRYQHDASLPRWIEMDELVGWGMVGLVEAGQRFDPAYGVKFETFAGIRIRGAIIDGLRGGDIVSKRTPETRALRIVSLDRLLLHQDSHGEDARGCALDQVNERELAEHAGRERAVSLSDELLRVLSTQQQTIIRLHYFEHESLPQIARRFKVSSRRVAQLHRAALDRMSVEFGKTPADRRVPEAVEGYCIHGHKLEGTTKYVHPRTGQVVCRKCRRTYKRGRRRVA